MRKIKGIVIHCTAGFGDVEAIKRFWKETLGWKQVGYHFFIYEDGKVEQLADIATVTNGVKGYNSDRIHIAYQGGVEKSNIKKAKDTRTPAQKRAIEYTIQKVIDELRLFQYVSNLDIRGHRDFSIDKNKNGIIESWERIKECPSFDAIPEYKGLLSKMVLIYFLCFLPLIGCKSSTKIKSITTVTDSSSYTSTYQERDTAIVVPKDEASSFIQCNDSIAFIYVAGQPRIQIDTILTTINGNRQAKLTVQRIPGTTITKLDCVCDTLSIQAKIRDVVTSTNQSKITQKAEYIPVKYIPKIVLILAWIGGITVLSIGLFFSFKLIKFTL